MTITSVQMKAMMDVVTTLLTTTGSRKRQIAAMFLELVDRADWPQYYEIIPEPRCLNNIKAGIEKNRYKDALDVYTDLSLVFWNALFYNEPSSQIGVDAQTLKTVLETEWKKHSALPMPRSSPPPSSAQKVHKVVEEPAPTAAPLEAPPSTIAPAPAAVALPTAPPIAVSHSAPAPVASTSTANHVYSRPVPIRPRSIQHLSTDMDVDIMSDGYGGDEMSAIMERDPESEEIVKQLEKGLPRWPGFGEQGWSQNVSPDRIIEIMHAIESYKDVVGNRIAVALETVPEEPTIPHLSYTSPLSFKIIQNHIRAKSYSTSEDFDLEMSRLFEKARRWHKPCTEPYGRVLLLQRLYQALTSSDPPPGPPYHTTTNFASLRAGPGNAKPVHTGGVSGGGSGSGSSDDSAVGGVAGVTTHRVLVKDRMFVDEVHYKGWSLKLADWVHLSNPDDPSRPIVAQVFRCWVSEEESKKGQQGITVSWYFRPEQTFHPANRTFWEGEVFKTSHFADHPLEDIIEKIACQFTARHIRGRPRPPFWYLGFPLYVCDSRYNDRDRVFVRIKNWNSCVPEEVRKKEEFMPIYPFEKTVMPGRLPSPFSGKGAGKKGPGGILSDAAGRGSREKVVKEEEKIGGVGEGGGRRTRRAGATGGDGGTGKGGANAIASSSLAAGYQYQPSNPSQQFQVPRPPEPDRSVITAAGGLAVLGQGAQVEKLPPETAKHFERDPETNEVLWFPAPPVDAPRRAAPKYSLAYLHFLAMKRKQKVAIDEDGDGGGMYVDEVNASENEETESLTRVKRPRWESPPPVAETLRV